MLQRSTLGNGLRVVTERVPHVRSVALGIWLGVGSRTEPGDLAGVSHFLEHLAFKGTTTRSARDLADAIDRLGGHMNAFTTREYTCYYARVLDEDLDEALALLADMLLRSRFDPADIETERSVALEELRLYEDTPDELVHDLAAACLWPGDPLGRPVLGSPDTLPAFTRDTLVAFHQRTYTPDNAVLVMVGRVDHAAAVERAAALFGGWAPAGAGGAAQGTPRAEPGRRVRVKDTEQVHLCVVGEGCSLRDPDRYGALVLVNILGGGPSSRLFQEVREARGLAYAIYAFQDSYSDTGMIGIYAGTGLASARQVLELIVDECRRLATEAVAAAELERTRAQLKAELVLNLESTSARLSRLGYSELLLGTVIDIDDVLRRVDAVDAGQVRRLARRLLDPGRIAVAAVAPVEQPFAGALELRPAGA